jgi:hypothetical protein
MKTDLTTEADRIEMIAAALESGKFEQALGALRVGDGYCCLGVACEIYRQVTGRGEWVIGQGQLQNRPTFKTEDRMLGEGAVLPPEVANWYGLSYNPILTIDGKVAAASNWNDTHMVDFSVIAKGFRARAEGKRNV